MYVREWIDHNKRKASTVATIALVAAVAYMAYQWRRDRPSNAAWYTTDDGRTWFKGSDRLVPPFDRDGKPAVLARVYRCADRPFVAWMERYKPEAARKITAYRAAEDAGKPVDDRMLMGPGFELEYKRPGEDEWTSSPERTTPMMQVDCPDGSAALIVYP